MILKKVLLFFVFMLILSPSASADYLPHQVNTTLEFSITSNNATNCNITNLDYPKGIIVIDQEMTQSGQTFNTTILSGNFTEYGDYCFSIECTDGSSVETGSSCRDVTYTGDKMTTQESYIYIISLIFIVIFIFGIGFIISRLPCKDSTDEYGYIIHINQLKYLRPVLWGFIWGLALAGVFMFSNISIAYLSNELVGNFFFVIYQVMFWFTIIMIPLWFIWMFVKIWQDNEVKKMIERGIDIKGKL